jgi:hypothetical protein
MCSLKGWGTEMEMQDIIRKNFVKYLVQKQIFCPITDEVLDVRTCVVIVDNDADPYSVISPNAYRRMLDTGVAPEKMLKGGYTFDQSTLPE